MYQSAQKMCAVNLGLIYRSLSLAKSLPITDTSMKTGSLSVIDLLEKWRLRTKWAKMAVCP